MPEDRCRMSNLLLNLSATPMQLLWGRIMQRRWLEQRERDECSRLIKSMTLLSQMRRSIPPGTWELATPHQSGSGKL